MRELLTSVGFCNITRVSAFNLNFYDKMRNQVITDTSEKIFKNYFISLNFVAKVCPEKKFPSIELAKQYFDGFEINHNALPYFGYKAITQNILNNFLSLKENLFKLKNSSKNKKKNQKKLRKKLLKEQDQADDDDDADNNSREEFEDLLLEEMDLKNLELLLSLPDHEIQRVFHYFKNHEGVLHYN